MHPYRTRWRASRSARRAPSSNLPQNSGTWPNTWTDFLWTSPARIAPRLSIDLKLPLSEPHIRSARLQGFPEWRKTASHEYMERSRSLMPGKELLDPPPLMSTNPGQTGGHLNAARIGRWIVPAIPFGWTWVPDFGIQKRADGVVPSNVYLREDELLAGNELTLYIQAQITMMKRTFLDPVIAGPAPL